MERLDLIGRLGADVETTENYSSISVACSHSVNKDGVVSRTTIWYKCFFRGSDALVPYLKKGATVFVSGYPSYRIVDSEKARGKIVAVSLSGCSVHLAGAAPVRDDNKQVVDPKAVF